MLPRNPRLLLATTLAFHCAASSALPLDNLGFESGLTGYNVAGNIVQSSQLFEDGNLYQATEGNYFALLTAEGADTSAYGGTMGAILSSSASFGAGDQLQFDWAFVGKDQYPYNDFALFIGDQAYLLADIASVGDLTGTGWFSSIWTAPSDFDGSIGFVVSDSLDASFNSLLLVDNLQVIRQSNSQPSSVPTAPPPQQVTEPASLGLLSLGVLALGAMARRRRM